jgi:uncharacterized protein with GYD domain
MPTYITLISYTQQGVENIIKESPAWLDRAKEAVKAAATRIVG